MLQIATMNVSQQRLEAARRKQSQLSSTGLQGILQVSVLQP
jgi:hypothetical protein